VFPEKEELSATVPLRLLAAISMFLPERLSFVALEPVVDTGRDDADESCDVSAWLENSVFERPSGLSEAHSPAF
jgi:hypothetical protein